MMAKNKQAKRRGRRSRDPRIGILWLALIIYGGLLAYGAVVLTRHSPTQTGQFQAADVGSAAFSHSLDLRVAAKNAYPSSPLTEVKDLGVDDNLDHEIISFKVPDDGLTEYGLMVTPSTKAPVGGWPAIVLCHGYVKPSEYMTASDLLMDMTFYAQHGFAVIKPDYRGQGLSLHEGQADSAYYSMSYNTDVMSLISELKQTSYIDKSNLNLWGFSMGAYVAFRAAVLSPSIKNLIILSGPVDSLSQMYLSYIPPSDANNLNALKTRNDVFAKYGTPAETDNFWKYASPINLVSRLKANVQIHVGALDQTVPPEFSADLDVALTKAHINHQYFVYPDGTHALVPQRPLIWSRSLQLLQSAPGSAAQA